MPSYTVSQLQNNLGRYIEPNGSFIPALEQALPRIYALGLWRDLTYETSLNAATGYISLPEDAESVLACTINDNPRAVRNMWHDVRIVGRQADVSPYFGIVDDGYHPVLLDMKDVQDVNTDEDVEPVTQLDAVNSGTSLSVDVAGYVGDITITGLTSSGKLVTLSQSTINNLTFSTGGVAAYCYFTLVGPIDGDVFSINGVTFVFRDVASGLLEVQLGVDDAETYSNAIAIINAHPDVDVSASFEVGEGRLIITYDTVGSAGNSVSVPTPAGGSTFSDYAGDVVTTLFGGSPAGDGITSIRSITFNDVPAAIDIVDPNFPTQVITTIPAGYGVLRYRRFRVSDASDDTIVHLLVKRACPTNITEDTVIHLGNINAIKHALLGIIAEDNADIQRAEYHWVVCEKLLDSELDANRGAAKPALNLNVFGGNGPYNFY